MEQDYEDQEHGNDHVDDRQQDHPDDGVSFVGPDGRTPVTYEFDYNELKQSVGVAVQWLAPLGIFRFSYGFPLNPRDGSATRYGDETESFQFTVGSAF